MATIGVVCRCGVEWRPGPKSGEVWCGVGVLVKVLVLVLVLVCVCGMCVCVV